MHPYAIAILLVFATIAAAYSSMRESLIASSPSDFNGVVRILEDREGVRRMRFSDSAIQSAYDPHQPERVVASYLRVSLLAFDLAKRPVSRVLVVGMGSGTMGMATRRRYPDAWIDLVDIDPVVVDFASRYMGFQPDSRMIPHVIDGLLFVDQITQPYDVIFLDAFNGIDPPPALITSSFFASIRKAVADGGVVAVNLVYRDVSPQYDAILSRLVSQLGRATVLEVPGATQNRVAFFPL